MSAETTYAGIHVAQRPRRIALRADRLFDGVRIRDRAAPVLLIDGDTIVAVLEGEPPADTDVVDLPGTTVLPGLVYTHVHLAFDASADPVTALAGRGGEGVRAAMTAAARTALAGGVTTIRDLGDRDYLSLDLRDQRDVPTIVAAGPPITTPRGSWPAPTPASRPSSRTTSCAEPSPSSPSWA